jgi:hypothetical protein
VIFIQNTHTRGFEHFYGFAEVFERCLKSSHVFWKKLKMVESMTALPAEIPKHLTKFLRWME